MKHYYILLFQIILILLNSNTFGQSLNPSIITPYHLYINCEKTTNLIFPYEILSVDRGSRDILAQKAIGVENVLQIKAAKPDFLQTNLTVITKEGAFYSFSVDYDQQPNQINFIFKRDPLFWKDSSTNYPETCILLPNSLNIEKSASLARIVMGFKRDLFGISKKKNAVKMIIDGIYVSSNLFFFKMSIQNKTNIDYSVDTIRFSTIDRLRSKRVATQEDRISPYMFYGDWKTINGNSLKQFIVAIPKFTFSSFKYLCISVFENGGSRQLSLKLKNKTILHAKQITPD